MTMKTKSLPFFARHELLVQPRWRLGDDSSGQCCPDMYRGESIVVPGTGRGYGEADAHQRMRQSEQ